MKKFTKILSVVLVLAMCFALLAGCGSSKKADDAVYTIKIDFPNPETATAFRAMSAWAEELKTQSNGRLDIKIYSGGALGSLMDCVTNCKSGTTDGFWSGVTIYAGTFPITEVFALPMIGAKDYKVVNKALNSMLAENEQMAAEWADFKVVALHSSAGSPILCSDVVAGIDDMAGMNMRISNAYTTKWFENLGINPVSVGINDGYENIQKSVIKGGLFFFDQVESSALYEVIKTVYVGQTIYPLNMLCLNKDVYNKLPDDLKKLIDDSGDFFLAKSIEGFDEQQDRMLGVCQDHGVSVVYEDDATIAKLSAAAEDAWAAWIETMNGKGIDGQGIFDTALSYIDKYNAE